MPSIEGTKLVDLARLPPVLFAELITPICQWYVLSHSTDNIQRRSVEPGGEFVAETLGDLLPLDKETFRALFVDLIEWQRIAHEGLDAGALTVSFRWINDGSTGMREASLTNLATGERVVVCQRA